MAAKLNGSNMDVTIDGTKHERVQVIVRDNVATARQVRGSRALIATKDQVVAVERPDRKTWVVQFADGTSWPMTRNADCGCR